MCPGYLADISPGLDPWKIIKKSFALLAQALKQLYVIYDNKGLHAHI